jgi:hypothetical protein
VLLGHASLKSTMGYLHVQHRARPVDHQPTGRARPRRRPRARLTADARGVCAPAHASRDRARGRACARMARRLCRVARCARSNAPRCATSSDAGPPCSAATSRGDYLFPVRVMGDLFRGKMLAAIEQAHTSGSVDVGRVDLRALHRKSWVVYAKRPFGGPEQVIRYLGRYTHCVGISNQRLVSMDERGVTLRTKDGKAVTVAGRELPTRPRDSRSRAAASRHPRCRASRARVVASHSIGASFSYACPASTPACALPTRRSPWSAPRSRSRAVVRLRWPRDRRTRSLRPSAIARDRSSEPLRPRREPRALQRPPRPHEGSAERPQRAKRPRRALPAQPLLRVASARLRTAPKQLPHSLH